MPRSLNQRLRLGLFSGIFFLAMVAASFSGLAQVTVFSEGFEGSFPSSGSWSVGDADATGANAYWSAVNSAFGGEGVHGGNFKGYCAGVGFSGTTNNPNYQADMSAFMSRQINLGGYTTATLSFWFKIPSIEEDVDTARVFIDGTMVWSTNAAVSGWTQATVNLNSFVGGLRTLKFDFLSDASVQFEGWYVDDILIAATLPTGPANDNFANSFLISGISGSTNGNNIDATKENGEPDHAENSGGKSIWYRWTPSVNGTLVVDTIGSGIDTLLAAYTGTNITNLTLIAQNDDIVAVSNVQSRLIFPVTAGTTYRIAVDGYSGASGTTVLNWNEVTNRPPNNSFASATVLSGTFGSINGTNINANKESGEPGHAGDAGGASVWYQWTPSVSRQVTFQTLGSTFDTLLGVYTGNKVDNLTQISTNDDISVNFDQSQLSFTASASTTYYIAVDGFGGKMGTLRLNWSQNISPTNNFFTNATILTGSSGTTNGTNFNATLEVGEPLHAGETGGHSVWYRWTAPSTSLATFDTTNSSLDTLLAVYTGTSVSNLSLVAENHYGIGSASKLRFFTTAGTTYRIAVDGFDGVQWTFKLNWSSQAVQAPMLTCNKINPASIQISATGNPGEIYQLDVSTNLPEWMPLLFITNGIPTIQPATNGSSFYRVELQP